MMSFSDVAMFTLPACPLAYSHCIMHPGLTRSKPENQGPGLESLSTSSLVASWFALEHYTPVGLCVSESLVSRER